MDCLVGGEFSLFDLGPCEGDRGVALLRQTLARVAKEKARLGAMMIQECPPGGEALPPCGG